MRQNLRSQLMTPVSRFSVLWALGATVTHGVPAFWRIARSLEKVAKLAACCRPNWRHHFRAWRPLSPIIKINGPVTRYYHAHGALNFEAVDEANTQLQQPTVRVRLLGRDSRSQWKAQRKEEERLSQLFPYLLSYAKIEDTLVKLDFFSL